MSRAAAIRTRLKEDLADLCVHYDRRFLDSDPVGIVRRFTDPDDREIAALIAAGLAYGRVASIRASLSAVFEAMGGRPARFVARFDPLRDGARLDGFVHRFTRGRDVALLCHLLRQAIERDGSLQAFFLAGDPDPASTTIEDALDAFGARLFGLDARPFTVDGIVPPRDGARWLVPLPAGGSACKRSCLFLRWVVRPDDGVDCGLWRRVSPSRLVLPLDTHLTKVVRALGWSKRRTAGWPMALEATSHLRALDPADPVRFDFALCRLGILGLLENKGRVLTAQNLRRALAQR